MKTIIITGASNGIGKETLKNLKKKYQIIKYRYNRKKRWIEWSFINVIYLLKSSY